MVSGIQFAQRGKCLQIKIPKAVLIPWFVYFAIEVVV